MTHKHANVLLAEQIVLQEKQLVYSWYATIHLDHFWPAFILISFPVILHVLKKTEKGEAYIKFFSLHKLKHING